MPTLQIASPYSHNIALPYALFRKICQIKFFDVIRSKCIQSESRAYCIVFCVQYSWQDCSLPPPAKVQNFYVNRFLSMTRIRIYKNFLTQTRLTRVIARQSCKIAIILAITLFIQIDESTNLVASDRARRGASNSINLSPKYRVSHILSFISKFYRLSPKFILCAQSVTRLIF